MRHLLVATCLAVLLGAITARTAGAVLPLEDDGFTPTTPRPDPDLIVVRERAYGAAGVDLTAYGIGSGPVSYVMSQPDPYTVLVDLRNVFDIFYLVVESEGEECGRGTGTFMRSRIALSSLAGYADTLKQLANG